jgi:hypothetical protein
MGIEASYRRLTAGEWERLQQLFHGAEKLDPWERYEAYAAVARSDELMASDRYLSIDKDWHALHCLLTGQITGPSDIPPAPPPFGSVVMGGAETPFDATYGKVRYLTPREVHEIAAALREVSADDLRARFDPVAFTEAEVYPNPRPGGWDTGELEPLLEVYPHLVEFFEQAARLDQIVLLSFD